MGETLLTMKDIVKSFYGVEVLHGIGFDLKKGEIHGLVGENGAGKSTMMSIIGGVYSVDSGTMSIEGSPYKPLMPQDATKAGISFIHQEFSLFSTLSVAENMFIDGFPRKGLMIDKRNMFDRTQTYIDLFQLDISPKATIETLPIGVRQILEISKALEKQSTIMIFDEPTTSLSAKEKVKLFDIIRKLKSDGVSIIFISHILDDVLELCDRISVIRDGNSVGTCDKADIDKYKMIQMMVGRELNQVYPTIEKDIGEALYEVNDFVCKGSDTPVSFKLYKGEIVGLFGLLGAGRTELLRSLYGVDPMISGALKIHGDVIEKPNPRKCIDHGLAFITEDRRNEGLIVTKTVTENTVMVILNRILKLCSVVDRKRYKETADKMVKQFTIKTANADKQYVSHLSGGNQQKVVVSKWMASEPDIFFMDEPTRGVDVGAKYEIYTYINQQAASGSAMLIVSSEMEELMGICDRIMVMHKNKIVSNIPKQDFDQEAIIKFALEGGAADG